MLAAATDERSLDRGTAKQRGKTGSTGRLAPGRSSLRAGLHAETPCIVCTVHSDSEASCAPGSDEILLLPPATARPSSSALRRHAHGIMLRAPHLAEQRTAMRKWALRRKVVSAKLASAASLAMALAHAPLRRALVHARIASARWASTASEAQQVADTASSTTASNTAAEPPREGSESTHFGASPSSCASLTQTHLNAPLRPWNLCLALRVPKVSAQSPSTRSGASWRKSSLPSHPSTTS